MITHILFDLDGTLTDPKEGITKCVQYALKSCGVEVLDLDRLTCFIGPPLQKAFQEFYGFDEEKSAFAVKKYRERFQTIGLFENALLQGVEPMLKNLKKRDAHLAVATSKPTVFSEKILKHFGMLQYFDFVSGSGMDGSKGEKADVICYALERYGMNGEEEKKQVLMIGDRKFDIEGAHQCGIQAVGVRCGYAAAGELEAAGADYIVQDIAALEELLLRIMQ